MGIIPRLEIQPKLIPRMIETWEGKGTFRWANRSRMADQASMPTQLEQPAGLHLSQGDCSKIN